MRTRSTIIGLAVLGLLGAWLFFAPSTVAATTCTSQQNGDWSAASTWTDCGGGVPQSSDDVVIQAGHAVTVTLPVTFNANNTLTISGTLAIEQSGGLTSTVGKVTVQLTTQKGAEIRVALSGGLDAAFQPQGTGTFDLTSLSTSQIHDVATDLKGG